MWQGRGEQGGAGTIVTEVKFNRERMLLWEMGNALQKSRWVLLKFSLINGQFQHFFFNMSVTDIFVKYELRHPDFMTMSNRYTSF